MSIKDKFRGYFEYEPDQLDELLKEAIIFLDTNVLLSLFEYTSESVDEIEKILTHRKFKGRFYITHQIGLEYARNRIIKKDDQIGARDRIEKDLKESLQKFKDSALDRHKRHQTIKIGRLMEELDNTIDNFVNNIGIDLNKIEEQNKRIEDLIEKAIGGNITEEFNEKEKSSIKCKADERFKKKIPPGYKDESRKNSEERQIGDLIIWFEMIKFAHGMDKKKKVIFITNDLKEDWWFRKSGKVIGPRPELIQEMKSEGIMYYQYTLERFMEFSSKIIENVVAEETLEEIEKYSQELYELSNSKIYIVPVLKDPAISEAIDHNFLHCMSKVEEVRRLYYNNTISKLEYERQFIRTLEVAIFALPENEVRYSHYLSKFHRYSEGKLGSLIGFAMEENDDYWNMLYRLEGELEDIKKRMKKSL